MDRAEESGVVRMRCGVYLIVHRI